MTSRIRALLAAWAMAWLGVGSAAAADLSAAVNYQGLWWNAPAGSESGWGINFAHQGDTIFATWFTFGDDGKPLWLVAAATKTGNGVYAGTFYSGTGPAFNAVPFSPGAVVPAVAGTATFTFADADNATFAYVVNGVAQTKQITRQVFGSPVPTCTWGSQPDLSLATNYQDMWWASPGGSESGWGINFTHQGDTIFATWFTFGLDGKPLWLVAAAPKTAARIYGGTMYTVTGPAFSAVPFDPAKVAGTPVGTATFSFADGNHATFAYNVLGVAQTKEITRQVFASPGTVCSTPDPAAKRKDAARFLRQATFGMPRDAIDALVVQGYDAWLADQFAKPAVSHVATAKADPNLFVATGVETAASLWKQYFTGEDQLRQRVSNALTQLFVVSFRNDSLQNGPCGIAGYLDMLNRDAFGNARTLLRDVTLSPAMGEYLSLKGSAKADPVLQTQPDENYAREVMQLFSVGTVMLNIDGSVQQDVNGKALPTYNETTVQGFAKALSGWSYAGQDQTAPDRWLHPELGGLQSVARMEIACTAWTTPMEPWLAAYRSADNTRTIAGPVHDTGAKQLLVYPGAPYSTLPAGQTPQADLENVIDNLFHHPNVGPFMARHLIQRMVTSNPSPQYIERVARKFNDDGNGVRGDMKAVIRAILLDDDARNPAVAAQPSFGKLTEPVVRFIQYNRAFNARQGNGYYRFFLAGPTELNQGVLYAPSVFNFYSPTFSPSGPLSQSSLVGPEFQITDASSVSGYSTFSKWQIIPGLAHIPGQPGTGLEPDYSYYLGLIDTPAALVDELDIVVCAGGLNAAAKSLIAQSLAKASPWPPDPADRNLERLYMVLWLLLNSPDCTVQR